MSEMILENMLDSLPGIFYMMDRRGYFIQWNQQFEHISEYSAKELAGIHALELFQGPDKRKLAASVLEVFKKGSSTVEADFVSKKGKRTPYYFTGKTVQTDGVTYLMGMGIDISERTHTEMSLKESEERFRRLTETSTDAIISIDSQGRIWLFNLAAERIFGYSAKEIYLQTIDLLIPEKYGAVFLKGIKRYFDTGVSTILGQIFEFKGRRKGGDLFPCELSLSEVKAGDEITFIGIIRDISERKKVEAELERFTNALKESNITKDKFFSIIAHDLKSPFNAILGLTNALIEDYRNLDEKRIESLLKTIKSSSERAFELLENLLVWANTQTGHIDYKPQPVSLKDLVDESIALLDGPAANKGIRIESELKAECIVMADRQMILTVLRNLISNAVKFTPFGGRIGIAVNPGQDFCEVSVRDSGIGIPKEYIEKLFRIETKHSTRGTADEKGTGLGLILCKEFVERHGGKIWVESEEGRGSTFYFTLPVVS